MSPRTQLILRAIIGLSCILLNTSLAEVHNIQATEMHVARGGHDCNPPCHP